VELSHAPNTFVILSLVTSLFKVIAKFHLPLVAAALGAVAAPSVLFGVATILTGAISPFVSINSSVMPDKSTLAGVTDNNPSAGAICPIINWLAAIFPLGPFQSIFPLLL